MTDALQAGQEGFGLWSIGTLSRRRMDADRQADGGGGVQLGRQATAGPADQGITAVPVGEMLTQRAFYAGWPSTFSALPVVKRLLAERAAKPAK